MDWQIKFGTITTTKKKKKQVYYFIIEKLKVFIIFKRLNNVIFLEYSRHFLFVFSFFPKHRSGATEYRLEVFDFKRRIADTIGNILLCTVPVTSVGNIGIKSYRHCVQELRPSVSDGHCADREPKTRQYADGTETGRHWPYKVPSYTRCIYWYVNV